MTYESTTDYSKSFQYPTATKNVGEPTYKELRRVEGELKANASSIDSDLGGGDHGYLGLVLTNAKYALVSATPFVAPGYHGTLNIPVKTTQVYTLG